MEETSGQMIHLIVDYFSWTLQPSALRILKQEDIMIGNKEVSHTSLGGLIQLGKSLFFETLMILSIVLTKIFPKSNYQFQFCSFQLRIVRIMIDKLKVFFNTRILRSLDLSIIQCQFLVHTFADFLAEFKSYFHFFGEGENFVTNHKFSYLTCCTNCKIFV